MKRLIQLTIILTLGACNSKTSDQNKKVKQALPEVEVTTIQTGEMHLQTEFNAYSQYQQKELLRSPISGYLIKVNALPGQVIRRGQTLFVMETQEARALKGVKLKNDTLLNVENNIVVKAPLSGVINSVGFQEGGFVQQGDQLADIIDTKSIVFVMNVPFEHVSAVKRGAELQVVMPGDQSFKATVGEQLPIASTATQVQSFILHPDSLFFVPENLNATVLVNTQAKQNTQYLKKEAVLTNETQTKYWVMQLVNDSTAVKVALQKGLETNENIEVISPKFNSTDKIILKGQFGLPDTATVKVVNK
ncbi:HlyD family efflux transporter periplasmic adaptor subunit [Ekhidna sp.]|uniref:efflux RND transporter periplasmic adaptor subunit n=1 Tax=Ekhidna sp. TaxID=2608089 RepID=UPI0032EE09F0